jgi:AraC-like DNA-binding protein
MKLKWPEWMRYLFVGATDGPGARKYGFNEASHIIHRLDLFMMEHKRFLRPHYTIRQLSEDTGIPASQISAAINLRKGLNFNEYVNKFRVRHCKRLIHEGGGKKVNIRDLSVDCGFHNRNTFTKAFKRFTGLTPSEYIKLNW